MMTSPSCLGLPAVRVRRCPPGVCHPRAMERKLIELEDGWAFMKARALGVAWARQAAPCPRAPHRRALRSLRRGHAGALSPVPVCADDVSRVVWCAACRARRAEGDHEAAQHLGGPAGGAVQRGGVHEPVHVRDPARPPAAPARHSVEQRALCLSLSLRVPRLDAALLPLLATASGQRDDTAPVAPAGGPPACLVACPGVHWAVPVASPTGASRHSP